MDTFEQTALGTEYLEVRIRFTTTANELCESTLEMQQGIEGWRIIGFLGRECSGDPPTTEEGTLEATSTTDVEEPLVPAGVLITAVRLDEPGIAYGILEWTEAPEDVGWKTLRVVAFAENLADEPVDVCNARFDLETDTGYTSNVGVTECGAITAHGQGHATETSGGSRSSVVALVPPEVVVRRVVFEGRLPENAGTAYRLRDRTGRTVDYGVVADPPNIDQAYKKLMSQADTPSTTSVEIPPLELTFQGFAEAPKQCGVYRACADNDPTEWIVLFSATNNANNDVQLCRLVKGVDLWTPPLDSYSTTTCDVCVTSNPCMFPGVGDVVYGPATPPGFSQQFAMRLEPVGSVPGNDVFDWEEFKTTDLSDVVVVLNPFELAWHSSAAAAG